MSTLRRAAKRVVFNPAALGGARLVEGSLKLAAHVWSRYRAEALIENLGDRSGIHHSTQLKYPENIRVGDRVWVGPRCTLGARSPIILEDFARISSGVVLETASLDLDADLPYPHVSKPIRIGRGAWIAANAVVLGGVTVGEYAVVGAGAVVTKDVPPRTIVVGAKTRAWTKR